MNDLRRPTLFLAFSLIVTGSIAKELKAPKLADLTAADGIILNNSGNLSRGSKSGFSLQADSGVRLCLAPRETASRLLRGP